MNGFIAAPGGEVCPAVLPAPFRGLGEDLTSNSVVCCVYKLPPHHKHSTQLLPGAQEDVSAAWLGGAGDMAATCSRGLGWALAGMRQPCVATASAPPRLPRVATLPCSAASQPPSQPTLRRSRW